jgi:hypothetical protein
VVALGLRHLAGASTCCDNVRRTENRRVPYGSFALVLLINSLPHFDYCCFVYRNINATQRKRLQNAQLAAIKYVYNVPYAASLSPFYLRANVLKIQERHDLDVLLMAHKIVYKQYDLVTLPQNVSARQTRALKFKINVSEKQFQ